MTQAISPKVISSSNGLETTRKAYQLLLQGMDTLDAAIEGVALVEADGEETSVGYGGLPNEEGVVELDAAVMHGPTNRAGGVASLRNIKHPSRVAKLVMERTDHVLLVGEGALRFARAHGFPEENLLTEKARKIWLHWKETQSEHSDWLPPDPEQVDPEVREFFENSLKGQTNISAESLSAGAVQRPTGTIHCAAINSQGEISCVTSTSGLAFKIPGRVGDSPIIGAGLFVDQTVGSCGSTGRGEANLVNVSSALAVELMRQGCSPEEAGLELMKRILKHTPPRLMRNGIPQFGLTLYLLNNKGDHAGVCLKGQTQYAITDRHGTRHELCTPFLKTS